ncbi:MAG: WG repeat-containing protein [Deltaproteobacteria bacterium]|jgi:hypothetical protein|nr:WG repeat-containing protein [Deltaproteobacteria bacterium]
MDPILQANTSVEISYGEIKTIPFPAKTSPVKMFESCVVITNGKFFSERFAILNLEGELIYDFQLKFNDVGKIKAFGTQSILIPTSNTECKLYDLKGKILTDILIEDAKDLTNNFLGIKTTSSNGKYALGDYTGKILIDFLYDSFFSYSEDIALSHLNGSIYALTKEGSVIFNIQGDDVRAFSNGFAVFIKDGLWGAMDTKGNVVVEPKYAWLSDFEEGYFRYSDAKNPKITDYIGLIKSDGTVKYDLSKEMRNVEIASQNLIRHNLVHVYEQEKFDKKYLHTVYAKGFAFDDTFIDAKYLYIGEESEGLRGFVSYKKNKYAPNFGSGTFCVGYMDMNFNPVITLLNRDNSTHFELNVYYSGKNFDKILGLFRQGYAVVEVKETGVTGLKEVFLGSSIYNTSYVIDRKGNEITDPDIIKNAKILHSNQTPKIEPTDNSVKVLEKLKNNGYIISELNSRKICIKLLDGLFLLSEELYINPFVSHQVTETKRFVFSACDTLKEFSCGIVKIFKNKMTGFADYRGKVLIEPIYNYATRFLNNASIAQKGKLWFILRRECTFKVISSSVDSKDIPLPADIVNLAKN